MVIMRAIERVTGDKPCWKLTRCSPARFRKTRPLYGAVDFQPYAADITRRAASLSPSAVLETAAGSGVVTRSLAPRLPRGASYIVTDLNQAMVDYAASRQPPDTRIKWRQADALALPFENAAFDLVCCQFGAMFFPNRTSGYREARRVLKPGGHFFIQRMGSHRRERFCG